MSRESPRQPVRRRRSFISFARAIRTNLLHLYQPHIFGRDFNYRQSFLHRGYLFNRPDLIEHVLLTNAENYAKSRYHRQLLGPVLGRGLLTSEGDFWRQQRQIAAPAFHYRKISDFVAIMAEEAAGMMVAWSHKPRPFDIAQEMMALTLTIITRTMFSTDVGPDIRKVEQAMTTMLELGKPSVLDLLGLPEWLPRPLSGRFRRAVFELETVIDRILRERRQNPADRNDLLSMLLAARYDTGEGMSDRQLRDEIMTIFLAGHETTANGLAWTFYLLSQHPNVEAKLHEEVDRILNGRHPDFNDLAQLTYTRAVFEEAIRLYPPAHTFLRTALADDEVAGIKIPKGTIITISPFVTHRNPKLWPDPEQFNPDRFLPQQTMGRPRYAYLPFGGGPRICIGNNFALIEAQVILAMVAQRYRVRVSSEHRVEPMGHVTLRPKNGIVVDLINREAAIRL